MAIVKTTSNFLKHSGLSFTNIINQTMELITDAGALGIFIYLSSKPEKWEICEKHLQNRFNAGRDYIRNKLKILQEIGLYQKIAIRDELGQIKHWETTLLNYIDIQITENPYSGKNIKKSRKKSRLLKIQNVENPECGKSAPINKRNKQIKEKTKTIKSFLSQNQKAENEKRHDFAQSMDQMACEKRAIQKHEEIKQTERTPMPEELKIKLGLKKK